MTQEQKARAYDEAIEKACGFIAENMNRDGYTLRTKATFINEFRNYMKGE